MFFSTLCEHSFEFNVIWTLFHTLEMYIAFVYVYICAYVRVDISVDVSIL